MFCKWCGMESATTDVCSWCHHALTETAPNAEEKTSRVEDDQESAHSGTGEIGLAAGVSVFSPSSEAAQSDSSSASPLTLEPRLSSSASDTAALVEGKRPIIGVKRPGGSRNNPAPTAPIVPRSSGTGSLNRTSVPASSPPAKPTPASSPVTPVNREAANGSGSLRNLAPVAAVPVKRAEPKTVRPEQAAPTEGAGDSGELEVGLAAGVAAPSRQEASSTAVMSHAPALGTFEAQNSKYYTGQVVDPVSGNHYDPATGQVTAPAPGAKRPEENVVLNWDEPKSVGGASVYVGALLAILVGVGLAVFLTKSLLVPLLLGNLVGGLLLPILRVGPWQDDDSDDSLLFFMGTLIFGPLVTAIIYGVMCAVRQGGNTSVLGCAVVALLTRATAEIASGAPNWKAVVSPWQSITFINVLVSWAGAAALLGWIVANTFHKADE